MPCSSCFETILIHARWPKTEVNRKLDCFVEINDTRRVFWIRSRIQYDNASHRQHKSWILSKNGISIDSRVWSEISQEILTAIESVVTCIASFSREAKEKLVFEHKLLLEGQVTTVLIQRYNFNGNKLNYIPIQQNRLWNKYSSSLSIMSSDRL